MKLTELPTPFQEFQYATEALESASISHFDILEKFPLYVGYIFDTTRYRLSTSGESNFFFAYDKDGLTECVAETLSDLEDDEQMRVLNTNTGDVYIATLKAELTPLS